MKRQKKIYLGHLNNTPILERIAKDNPSYIYFICFLGSKGKLPIYSQINDIEVDCRALHNKYRLTKFIPQSERVGHYVTQHDCQLRSPGKKVFNELKMNGICKKLWEFLKSNENCTRKEFNKHFNERFSFEVNPNSRLKQKIREYREKYDTSFPGREISYRNMIVKPVLKGNNFYYEFKIECFCSNLILKELNMNYYNKEFSIECDQCHKIYHIIYNFLCYW
ncbi:MAG: hypothetical protein GF311_10085 [Candidatus Lokiarchaeota archaeon]|nr:hypothetical protein [Candidatus Lokiarchaeota archaeon]